MGDPLPTHERQSTDIHIVFHPSDPDITTQRQILPAATAWNDELSRKDVDGARDDSGIGPSRLPSTPGHRRSLEYPKQSSLDLSPGSARSNSSWDANDLSDVVSVRSAVDRGFTAAEAKYLNDSHKPVVQESLLSHHGTDTSPFSNQSDNYTLPTGESSVELLTGVGDHFGLSDTQGEGLNDLIRGSLEKYGGAKGTDDRKLWLPIDKLLLLVDEEHVFRELSKLVPACLQHEDVEQHAKKICESVIYTDKNDDELKTSSRSIFAILVLLDRAEDIITFIDAGISDRFLPLKRVYKSDQLSSHLDGTKHWNAAGKWSQKIFDMFFQYQDYMLSPFFKLSSAPSTQVFLYELGPYVALPFIEVGKAQRHGHHGSVWQVKIHPSHHDAPLIDGTEDPWYAVKRLEPCDQETGFLNEVNAWKKSVGNTRHRHLITILATWHQDGSYFLLFPWADSNLRDYWKSKEPAHSPSLVCWMAKQCLGIMQGLKKIHRSDSDQNSEDYGIHGDIKPENILWFKDRGEDYGTLVICDFGFTQFHDRKSRSNAAPNGVSGTYRAPEIDTTHRISRAYDVWTIGCLYLEFITWYLTGSHGVKCFENKRLRGDLLEESDDIRSDKFFNYTKRDGAVVKPAVSKWMQRLHRNPRCSQYFHDLLDFIEKECLVIMPNQRATCGQMAEMLRKQYKDCKNLGEYHYPRPWPTDGELSPIDNCNSEDVDWTHAAHKFRQGGSCPVNNTFLIKSDSTVGNAVFAGLDDALFTKQTRRSSSPSSNRTGEISRLSKIDGEPPLIRRLSNSNRSIQASSLLQRALSFSPKRDTETSSLIIEGEITSESLDQQTVGDGDNRVEETALDYISAIPNDEPVSESVSEPLLKRATSSPDEHLSDQPTTNTVWKDLMDAFQLLCNCWPLNRNG